jgi:membrane-associated phospholipid phosphatase
LIVTAVVFVHFLEYHEEKVDRLGWEFKDPAFLIFPRFNCSTYIFTITYGSMIIYVFTQYKTKLYFSKLMISYTILLILRMFTLTLLPFQESSEIIFLEDPFLNTLVYPGNIDGDLFFSGHTALLFILLFLTRNKIFLILGIILGLLLIIQRVHYSIDVLAAIPFAYLIVRITEYMTSRLQIKD